jgi:hypothetical protein
VAHASLQARPDGDTAQWVPEGAGSLVPGRASPWCIGDVADARGGPTWREGVGVDSGIHGSAAEVPMCVPVAPTVETHGAPKADGPALAARRAVSAQAGRGEADWLVLVVGAGWGTQAVGACGRRHAPEDANRS